MDQMLKCIQNHRSIRIYQDWPFELSIRQKLMETMNASPTSNGLQSDFGHSDYHSYYKRRVGKSC
ncbi:hypothetical protein SAMN05421791_10470 [Facklamia miroungae]|uniref:Uncharacterized protein n=1 Tax=Facklamia miroungae TaxID=120956 RepID=A0A1G7SLE5_9LACT|nr:hypothetical protein SAMN05421791_10470 [Facklamia miroungae]